MWVRAGCGSGPKPVRPVFSGDTQGDACVTCGNEDDRGGFWVQVVRYPCATSFVPSSCVLAEFLGPRRRCTSAVAQCDDCQSWEHGLCAGYSSVNATPDVHVCSVCKPEKVSQREILGRSPPLPGRVILSQYHRARVDALLCSRGTCPTMSCQDRAAHGAIEYAPHAQPHAVRDKEPAIAQWWSVPGCTAS